VTTPLSPLARVLLRTDGTVTYILEAYADEPIDVVKLGQVFGTADDRDADLLLPGGRVLRREVLLRGRHSLRNLVHAEAVIALDRVEPTFLEGLVGSDEPIGVLLAESRTEAFREILRTGRQPAAGCGPHFGMDPASDVVSRTYRIVARQQPIILITETFPPGLTGDL
jgi:chorismate-pyruvate lyase